MGIKDLSKLIADVAPKAIKKNEMKNYFGRKVAIDASMSLYQFLIAVRSEGAQLTDADGETTSHLMGTFYRTIRMIDNGLKPVYVFDGKPPTMKSGELDKRMAKRADAETALEKAKEEGNEEEVDKQSRRLVKVGKSHVDDCKKLLKFMGVPFVSAPCEAESQCAELVKKGKVWAVGTEDMDALTFGTNVLLRHLTFSEARLKETGTKEFHLREVLEGLEMSQNEFIDLCIMLGCDYCEKIRGMGPKNALKAMQEHRSIEKVIENLDKKKYTVPENWMFAEARRLFITPDVTPAEEFDFKWEKPDIEGLVQYMCEEKGFEEGRIRNGAAKLTKAREVKPQGRLDGFFKVLPSTPKSNSNGTKRKSEEVNGSASKKGKAGNGKKGFYKR